MHWTLIVVLSVLLNLVIVFEFLRENISSAIVVIIYIMKVQKLSVFCGRLLTYSILKFYGYKYHDHTELGWGGGGNSKKV